jgi:DNA polymerase III delta prime subunit
MIPDSEGASIGIISSDQGDYYVKNFSLEGKTPEFTYPDLHYGTGFDNFHQSLTERVKTTTKGLILLHGEPGTGKTQYIRVLLKELAKMNKAVLYAPPSLSASLTDPEMIEFISNWVIDNDKDCILLIEDAEPLLEARNGADGRTTGISNLLNMTDGLLNDILGLMVIATFNTELSKIDSALLRPQRLLARKEFKKMPEDRAEKLAEALNIEKPSIAYPASLAEFYAAKQHHEVIIHDVDEERKKIGFR